MKVVLNLYVMWSIAPAFLFFFRRKCASQESRRIRWVHFPCVFSGSPRLAFRSDCEFTCDAANCSRIPNTFPRKTHLALFSVPHKPLLWEREMLGHVTHNSSKRMSHQKVGMSKVAYHRMLVGGLDVVKRAKRWNTIGPSQKRQPFKGARKKCDEIVLSMCTAQCGSMEAKALSFVLRAAGSEHHQSSTRRVLYVCSGRAGGNERHLLFYARYEETSHPSPWVVCKRTSSSPPHPPPTSPPNPSPWVV